MKLNDIFTRNVVSAEPEETLANIAVKMQEHNVGCVVIVKHQRPVGIVTDRDLALALAVDQFSPLTQVAEVMTRHVLAIPEDMGIETAIEFMRDREVRRLPVVDREDRLVGLVTLDDLVRLLGRELFSLMEGMKHEMEVK